MKKLIIFVFIFIHSCTVFYYPKTTHCYLYAAKYLLIGNIEIAFKEADNVKHLYPERGYICDIIYENFDKVLIYHWIEYPTEEDFELCQNSNCAIHIEGHDMAYDYHNNIVYDNGNCQNGCFIDRTNIKIKYLHSVIIHP